MDQDALRTRISEASDGAMAEKTQAFGQDVMRKMEKQVLLQAIDAKWREHLLTLEHLRSVVGFRGYAQRDPLNEYKTESFSLFESMLNALRVDVTQKLGQLRPLSPEEQEAMVREYLAQQQRAAQAANPVAPEAAASAGFDETDPTTWGTPGRNDLCPCGSGEKFKHCHGKLV